MTFAVLAPEHPRVGELTKDEYKSEVQNFCLATAGKTDLERLSEDSAPLKERGVFTGSYLFNPFTQKPVPVYLADYVIMEYGTGAVMAVPGEDQRDWDFAEAFGLEIIRTVQPPEVKQDDKQDTKNGPPSSDNFSGRAYSGEGKVINSDWLNNLKIKRQRKKPLNGWKKRDMGKAASGTG